MACMKISPMTLTLNPTTKQEWVQTSHFDIVISFVDHLLGYGLQEEL